MANEHRYRKKPVEIEAVQWVGDNFNDIMLVLRRPMKLAGEKIEIETLEGTMLASLNDWIIKGVKGEIYPCKPDIFAETYEPVDDDLLERLDESYKQDGERRRTAPTSESIRQRAIDNALGRDK